MYMTREIRKKTYTYKYLP